MNHSQIVSFIWGVADLIRDTFKRGKYQDVILPLTVLRRLDCVLAPTKRNVLEVQARYAGKIGNLDPQLRRASGFAFYNTSRYDFEKLLADAPHIAQNLRNYIAGFSPNMREVLEKFDFDNTISKLDESGLLFQVVQRFGDPQVNLHPDAVDNAATGTIFEELIRKFNEALNENPGEHFTPRDVVHLMVDLLLAGDEERLRTRGVVLSVYDPCCGSGGMLTIAKEHLTAGETRDGERRGEAVNPDADIHLFGQEVNPETFAICKSDLFMKSEDGRDAENVLFGSTVSNDRHGGAGFDYMIANPPYGTGRQAPRGAVRAEAGHPAAAGRLRGRRHPQGRAGRRGVRDRRQPRLPHQHFGFRKITVERPLRLDFQASPERIARLDDERAFANLAGSRKRGEAQVRDEEAGREQQDAIRALVTRLPDELFLDRADFEAALSQAAREADLKLAAPIRKAILSALSERNDEAEICRDREGRPEPDPELRDTENVPLRESIETFFAREVKPHVPDAWIDTARRDPQDGEVGLVGYEINFNRYFYEYRPPRPLEEIEADIQQVEKEIVAMLREMTG